MEAANRALERAAQLEAAAGLRLIVRIVHVQDDRDAWRRSIRQDGVIEKAVGVRNPATRAASRHGRGLRQIKAVVGKRVEDVIGQFRSARVGGPLDRRIAAFREVQPRRCLVQELHILDRVATEYGDGGRQVFAEELALIVAHDHHGFRGHLFELARQDLHRPPALRMALLSRLQADLAGEPRRAFPKERFKIVGLAAEPMPRVFSIGLCAEIPLIRRRREQRSVRRGESQDDVCQCIRSLIPNPNPNPNPQSLIPNPSLLCQRSGRHRENRRSRRAASDVRRIPAPATIMTPTNSVSVAKVCPPYATRKPIPWLPPNISPTTTPISPSATPCRTPVRMNGTAPGTPTALITSNPKRQKSRPRAE